MKIKAIETFDVRWPFTQLHRDSINVTDAWGFAVVRLHCDDGSVGTGYAGTARGIGNKLILDTVHEHFGDVLLGANPTNISALWRAMYWAPIHWCGRAGVTQMALSAVDIALWDLAAQAGQLPLCDVLGSSEVDSFSAYNTDGGWLNYSIDELTRYASASIDRGFAGVKMKLGHPDPREDVRRISAVRRAIGDDAELMTDVNQMWDLATAREIGAALDGLGVKWLEEPLDPDDWRSHVELAGYLRTPLAIGEQLYSLREFDNFISAEAAFYLQPDVTRVGGVSEFVKIATLAGARGRPLCTHAGDMMQVNQHLIFAAPTAHRFEHIPWGRDLFVEPAVICDGRIVRPTAPGAGTAMHDDALQRYVVSPPRLSQLD